MLRKRITRSLIVALLAGVATAAAAGAPASPQLHALVRTGTQMQLTRVDPATLAPTGRRVALGRNAGGSWAYSPDRRHLAISTEHGIRLVDVRSRRVRATLARPHRLVRGLAWLAPRRLLVLEHGAVLRVDPARPRIVSQEVYGGSVLTWAPTPGGVVLLMREEQGIGPPTLVVVGWAGKARSVELQRIDAGSYGGPNNEGPFRTQYPALAVDPGGRAYVVGGGALVATVALDSLAVAYHVPVEDGRFPAARSKAASGSVREAAWLGGGLLAVTGSELASDGESQTGTPIGLRVIDTRSWRSRAVDPEASSVAVEAGTILASGVRWNGRGPNEGMGVAGYAPDGSLRFRVFEAAPVGGVSTGGGRAYFWAGGLLRAVDAATGRLVASARPREPFVLLTR